MKTFESITHRLAPGSIEGLIDELDEKGKQMGGLNEDEDGFTVVRRRKRPRTTDEAMRDLLQSPTATKL